MAAPWEKYGGPPASAPPPAIPRVIEGPPREPAPRHPEEAAKDVQDLRNAELTPENMRFQNEGELRTSFAKLPEVQNYRTVIPIAISAMKAADNTAGDLDIVYAFGKVMDPGSVVREGEMDMVQGTGAVAERVKGYLRSLQGQGRLTPQQRKELLGEIRNRASSASDMFNQTRSHYRGLAQRYGFDEEAIVGPHPGLPFQQDEANYTGRPVRNQDGTLGPPPVSTNGRLPLSGNRGPTGMEATFGDEPVVPNEAFMQDWKARNDRNTAQFNAEYLDPNNSYEYLLARSRELTGSEEAKSPEWAETLRKAVRARDAGKPTVFAPGPISNPLLEIPARQSNPELDEAKLGLAGGNPALAGIIGLTTEKGDAAVRGMADVVTLGLADEIAAAGDTIFGEGTYQENLWRERGIDRYDEQNNALPRIGGQIAGAFVLPTGRLRSTGDLVKVGAGYGAGYGFGSGEGDLLDRTVNAAFGGVSGAGGSYVIGKGAPLVNRAASALGRKVFGEAPVEAQNVLAAADRQNVPINAADVRPGTRNAFGFLESSPGSAGPIQRSIAEGRDALEARVTELGGTGAARSDDEAGQLVRNAGERFIRESGTKKNRLYNRAETLAGNPSIETPKAVATLDAHIAELSQTENANKGLLGLLSGLREDLSKPITISALRRLRSSMRGEIGTRNLTASDADRIVGDVLEAASQDIAAGLASKPEALAAYQQADEFYKGRQTYIQDVLQRFLGRKDAPLSAEKTIGVLRGMAKEKGGDARRFEEMINALDPEERADVAATFAAQLGRKSDAEPFSPLLFINGVRDIGGPARRLLFGERGAEALDDLITLANAKKGTVERLNNSRSGQVSNYRALIQSVLFGGTGGGTVATLSGGGTATGVAAGAGLALTGVAGSRLLANAFTNPRFVRLLAEAPDTTSARAIDAHIGKLRQLGAKDPNVRAAVQWIEESLLRAANERGGQSDAN